MEVKGNELASLVHYIIDIGVLILDEGTSALDSSTETSIIETIGNISEELTILMVAHRISTLDICDRIYSVDKGTLWMSN